MEAGSTLKTGLGQVYHAWDIEAPHVNPGLVS